MLYCDYLLCTNMPKTNSLCAENVLGNKSDPDSHSDLFSFNATFYFYSSAFQRKYCTFCTTII